MERIIPQQPTTQEVKSMVYTQRILTTPDDFPLFCIAQRGIQIDIARLDDGKGSNIILEAHGEFGQIDKLINRVSQLREMNEFTD